MITKKDIENLVKIFIADDGGEVKNINDKEIYVIYRTYRGDCQDHKIVSEGKYDYEITDKEIILISQERIYKFDKNTFDSSLPDFDQDKCIDMAENPTVITI